MHQSPVELIINNNQVMLLLCTNDEIINFLVDVSNNIERNINNNVKALAQ
jgi:hypothetical protein